VARIGNRTAPGRYTIGSWRVQEAADAQRRLERQVITTQRLTVVRCVYRPGTAFPAHFHPQEQITIVEEGSLRFIIDGEPVDVVAGQMIAIPPHVRHATRVNGSGARALNLFLLPESNEVRGVPAAQS
jgi:quercetin dioxygenase-like cupin family protein